MAAWKRNGTGFLLSIAMLGVAVGTGPLLSGCGAPPMVPGDPGGGGGTDPTGGGKTPLSYGGKLSGTVSTSISTSDASATGVPAPRWAPKVIGATAQTLPTVGANATLSFKDLNGNPLKDAEGNELPSVPLNTDGSFSAEGLPVGVDFVVEVDLDGDGNPDLTHIVSIPKDEEGEAGSINNVNVNPLTTMAVAKLKKILEEKGVTGDDLDFSPAVLIGQMITAFTTLFEAMGIDSTITADQIMSKTIDALAAAFDELIPDSVKATIDIATSQLDIAGAETAEDLVLAVIPALLRAGIAIADEQGGTVLDSLASLPNVEVVTWEELFQHDSDQPPPPPGGALASPGRPDRMLTNEEGRIFRSTVVEVDRNFAALDKGPEGQMRLVIRKHALERMAGLAFQGKTLAISDLHMLLTHLGLGMGLRLSYGVPMPPPDPDQPFEPMGYPQMFQSADQHGVLINTQELSDRIFAIMNQGTGDPGQRESQMAAVREILKEVLAATQPPSFAQLFGGILSDSPITFDKLSATIRHARSHLPWNWSGPAMMHVLADRDRWRDQNAKAVTVDVLFDGDGRLAKVTFNPNDEGKHYLRWFGGPEGGYAAELVVVTTGRMVFDNKGWPIMGNLADGNVFAPIGGVSFLETFSETGENWPIEPALTVPNPWYDPDKEPDPSTNPPTVTKHVLVTQPGPDGEVVKVSVANDGSVVRDTSGGYALDMFWEGPPVEGWMAFLTDVRTGQRLRTDPSDPWSEELRVRPEDIVNLEVAPQVFTHVFGIEVPNPMYNPEGDPWYDDINGNGVQDADEPTFDWKEEIWQAGDWRSTNVERYYRRADNNGFVKERDVNWGASTPQTWTGVALVPRNFRRRGNAFTFGRPNSAMCLLSAFLGEDFFNGTHRLNADTRVSPFGALAVINLVFDARLYNLEAYVVDYGPDGPRPAALQIVEAWPWTPPIDDPVFMMVDGFENLAAGP